MNTRRHPRTLEQAFGPYTSHDLQPMRDARDYSSAWWAAMLIVGLVTVALIGVSL